MGQLLSTPLILVGILLLVLAYRFPKTPTASQPS
jgi:prolipoprotein diacylglyceryltransferase